MSLARTPLFEQHLSLGAKMVPFAGWEMPVSYPAGIIAEHNAVRNFVGIFDIGHMGLIKLTIRSNMLNYIQYITTNDATKLEINQCQYSILCDEKGGVVDDILVYRLPDFFLIIANASNTDKVLAWLKKYAAGFGAINISLWGDYSMLSLQGPKALEAAGISPDEIKRNHVVRRGKLLFSRTGYTGEDGVEIIAPKEEIPGLWDAFIRKGIQPCGLGARDTLRLEAGLPLYGHEYDEETTPLEAGYGWAVKFDKGDFIGRSALLREKEAGPKKHLVGLELEGRAIPRKGNLIVDRRQAKVGAVASGTFSPTFKRPIALAYLTSDEKEVFVEIRGEPQPARVVDKAFYKRVK
jgi:aminomethyltransferase